MNTQLPFPENFASQPQMTFAPFFGYDASSVPGTFINFNLFVKKLVDDNQRLSQ